MTEYLDDLFGFPLAQKPVIDMHADQLLTDRLDQKRGDNRAVHPARQSEQHLFVAYPGAKLLHLLVNKRIGKLGSGDSFHCFGTYISLHNDPP